MTLHVYRLCTDIFLDCFIFCIILVHLYILCYKYTYITIVRRRIVEVYISFGVHACVHVYNVFLHTCETHGLHDIWFPTVLSCAFNIHTLNDSDTKLFLPLCKRNTINSDLF